MVNIYELIQISYLLLTCENCCWSIGKPPPGNTGASVGLAVAMTIWPGLEDTTTKPVGAGVAMTSPGGLYDTPGISHWTLAQHCPGITTFLQYVGRGSGSEGHL